MLVAVLRDDGVGLELDERERDPVAVDGAPVDALPDAELLVAARSRNETSEGCSTTGHDAVADRDLPPTRMSARIPARCTSGRRIAGLGEPLEVGARLGEALRVADRRRRS